MSTSNTHQQSLADAGSETRPLMLEKGSYIPWASCFRRYLNRKRENRKWLNKAIDEGPYEFKEFTPSETEPPKMQKEEDLKGDDLKHYEAEIEAMNLILISIPNDIYNSVDACTTIQAMWQIVECLMRGIVQNKIDRETRFNNEFDQFVAEPGEALVSVYNRIDQLMNDLERNGIKFPPVTINTKFLNCLQPEWLKAKKLEKSHDPLALVAHTGSSSRTNSPYYVTHPSSVIDYDEDYQEDAVQNTSEDPLTSAMIFLARAITQHFSNQTNNHLRTSSNTKNQAIIQADRVQIQSKNSGNDGRNTRRTAANVQCYNCSEKGHYARNCPKPKELSTNICLMARIQPANFNSDEGPSYDSAFLSEQLARNAYKEAEKQQIIAKKVQQQNTVLTKQLESYKEKVRVFEMNKGNNTTYINEYIEADQKAKQFEQESQSQFIHDRDIICDLEQQHDKLELSVVELKRQTVELQKTQSILKRKMSENEDKYHDTVLDHEARS
ncbi:retrovirus-related pol polyprotein from transposon TNT 1-94 [Tanacetum coccineum]